MKTLLFLVTLLASTQILSQTSQPSVSCQIIEVPACPQGTFSYACNGRSVYEVSCATIGVQFAEKAVAQREKQDLESKLNSCMGY